MPNYFQLNYSLGKIHTGMLIYLVEMWNEGNREPLNTFFSSLKLEPIKETKLIPKAEYNNIDLVIFDQNNTPLLVVEMKVDDYEHEILIDKKNKKKLWQTDGYYEKVRNSKYGYLFITLGTGEFYYKPIDSFSKWKWVKLEDLYNTLSSISSQDTLIIQWKNALIHEIKFREESFNSTFRIKETRKGSTNLYTLGKLKEDFLNEFPELCHYTKLTVYKHGTAPDTILNFGFQKFPFWFEINSNSKLNVKVSLEHLKDIEEKQKFIKYGINYYNNLIPFSNKVEQLKGKMGKTKTILSYDVGLKLNEHYLITYNNNKMNILKNIKSIIEPFYLDKVKKH